MCPFRRRYAGLLHALCCAYIQSYIRTYIATYRPTYIHTGTHTRIHAYYRHTYRAGVSPFLAHARMSNPFPPSISHALPPLEMGALGFISSRMGAKDRLIALVAYVWFSGCRDPGSCRRHQDIAVKRAAGADWPPRARYPAYGGRQPRGLRPSDAPTRVSSAWWSFIRNTVCSSGGRSGRWEGHTRARTE